MRVVVALITWLVVVHPMAFAQHGHGDGPATDYRSASAEAWLGDIDRIDAVVRARHPLGRDTGFLTEWDAALSTARQAVEDGDAPARLAALHRLVASIGDGHTNLVPFYVGGPGFEHRYPLRAYQFADGVYLTAIAPDHDDLLGARIEAINGVAAGQLTAVFEPLIGADNRQWQRNWSAFILAFPAYLDIAGAGGNTATLSLTLPGGDARQVTLPAGPQTDLAELAAPARPDTGSGPFGLARIDGGRAAFIRFEAVEDGPDETLAAFAARVAATLADPQVERVIVDIRENGGGNNELSAPLVRALIASRQNRPGGLYVLTGRISFSAAMNFATQMERFTSARFVGEPTGGAPNHYGDPEFVMLEGTGIPMLLSTLHWQDSHPSDTRGAIDPDLYVPETIADRLAGRDAALEAALGDQAAADMTDPIRRWSRGCQLDCE